MKNSELEKEPKIEHDQQTKELLERSDRLINKSQMIVELCQIQSKTVERLLKQAEDLKPIRDKRGTLSS